MDRGCTRHVSQRSQCNLDLNLNRFIQESHECCPKLSCTEGSCLFEITLQVKKPEKYDVCSTQKQKKQRSSLIMAKKVPAPTKGQLITTIHLPGVEGLAVCVDELLHLQVLSHDRHPRGLQHQNISGCVNKNRGKGQSGNLQKSHTNLPVLAQGGRSMPQVKPKPFFALSPDQPCGHIQHDSSAVLHVQRASCTSTC